MKHSHSIFCTYDDYLTLPNDGRRYEVIDGELTMAPAPFTDHQDVLRNLEFILVSFLRKTRWGILYAAPTDVVFSMTDIVQPDLLVVARERKEIITKKNIIAAPDLVIEILSPSSTLTDRTTKKALYEKYGVKEYWIVDPDEQAIEVFNLENKIFIMMNVFKSDEQLTSKLLKELVVDLKEVFET
ncbi:MAG: Uma2 family endonuclease [Ignavibacteriae bacterium]|nr:Uma2 family endonuclease [Ignavibacteriota bacterium]